MPLLTTARDYDGVDDDDHENDPGARYENDRDRDYSPQNNNGDDEHHCYVDDGY